MRKLQLLTLVHEFRPWKLMMKIVAFLIALCATVTHVLGHGRLLDPPARNSMWRYGFKTEPNYDDNGLNCGGRDTHFRLNSGKCGICGDDFADPAPRKNENGGQFGRGIITKSYLRGGLLPVIVQLTASHLGYFEFSLCDLSQNTETEDCFKTLQLVDGSSRFYVKSFLATYVNLVLQIPRDISCKHCVLRWHYRAGNSLGGCGDGRSSTDCADQETFRNCADITIN